MILILADSTDPWATLVHRMAQRKGGGVFWVEPLQLLDKLPLNRPVVTGESIVPESLEIDGQVVRLDHLTGMFARLPVPLRFDLDGLPDSDAEYLSKEATVAWLAFLNMMPCSVVSQPISGGTSTHVSGSPLLAKLARDHGFLLPVSRSTSSLADALQQFMTWGETAYLKPLGSVEPGQFLDSHDGVEQIRCVMEQHAVSLQRVPQGQQATVYVAGAQVAATVLRPGEAVPQPMEVLSAHAAQCLGLARSLGLAFAECQVVITPAGGVCCLDISSAPNFWRCPQNAQQKIVAHLFEHLSEVRNLSHHDSSNGADGRSRARGCMRPPGSPEH